MQTPLLRGLSLVLGALLLSGCMARGAPVSVAPTPLSPKTAAAAPNFPAPTPAPTPAPSNMPTPTPPAKASVRLLAGGDNLIHDVLYQQAAKRAAGTGRRYDFSAAYQAIAPLVKSADLAMLNQESPICPDRPPKNYPQFCSPPELIEDMQALGFTLFSLANNHMLDQTATGLAESLSFWRTQTNAHAFGLYSDATPYIPVVTKNGISLSFLSFTEHTNGLFAPECGIVYTKDREKIKALIQTAKAKSDFVVVSVHWGVEDSSLVHPSQRQLARDLAEWGAGAIFGTGPHVLQPIETITTTDNRSVVVAYSLGNLISAQVRPQNLVGGLLEVTFSKAKNHATAIVTGFTPTVTHYGPRMREVAVYSLSQYTKTMAASHGIRASAPDFSIPFIQRNLLAVPGVSDYIVPSRY